MMDTRLDCQTQFFVSSTLQSRSLLGGSASFLFQLIQFISLSLSQVAGGVDYVLAGLANGQVAVFDTNCLYSKVSVLRICCSLLPE